MKKPILTMMAFCVAMAINAVSAQSIDLEQAFTNPPDTAKAWCYWWWLNGAASNEGIARDFEEMKKQGISGALLFNAGKAGPDAPRGPEFMSAAWRELFQHAVREADRLGIALGVNLCSGWDCGGPWVTPEHAAKKLVATQTVVNGPGRVNVDLAQPPTVETFYRDVAVLACPVMLTPAEREASQDGPRDHWDRNRIVDLTKSLSQNPHGGVQRPGKLERPNGFGTCSKSTDGAGRLTWDVPTGAWRVMRIGYTLHGNQIKLAGSSPTGLEIDTMSAAAMDAHFAETGAKLVADAGSLVGKTLQYFHIDSWELGQPTWTPDMREEFQKRRGYDPLLYLPTLLQGIVDDAETTRRFLADYRRTAADLVAANYYGRLRKLSLKHGLRGTHPESGGPFFEHWIDALQCEGINDIPMGEFWRRDSEPDGPIRWPPEKNPTVKQAACAAHIYGKPLCQAEAFTSFACDWTADPWNMKDIGDEAFCHGLTRNVLCFYVHQPRLDIQPGYQWAHVGTHFDRNITWWDMSHGWLTYMARCQHMLRQGRFVADFAYFRGEGIPGFIAPSDQLEPLRPVGFDHDVLNAEVLLTRAAAKDGRLTLPDGMSYRYLVLPHRSPWAVSPSVLRKVKELATNGVTVIGPRPDRAVGLTQYPSCDEEVKKLATDIWGPEESAGKRTLGLGRVIWGHSLDEVVRADGVTPDLEFRNCSPQAEFGWIHRRDRETDIYFLSNQASLPATAEVVFRVTGKQPELWDPVTSEIDDWSPWREANGRTVVLLKFAPRQSFFIVFRRVAKNGGSTEWKALPDPTPVAEIPGPWDVSFDPKWGGPKRVTFATLEDWSQRPEDGIRYYSGKAVYRTQFKMPSSLGSPRLFLDLGTVKNLARVRVNDRDLGVVWTAPWRVEIGGAVREGTNQLEIEVVNLWPNRLIGDAMLPSEKRFTVTNVRTYDTMTSGTYGCKKCEARRKSGEPAKLLPSGLLGPVTLRVH